MSRYCQVIVDIAAEQVDKLFTYAVPQGLLLQPGQRVLVPFGPRTKEGYVLSLSEETDVPQEKLRAVLRALEEYPAILPELVHLAGQMARRYRCSLCEALRLMIPAEMRGGRIAEKKIHIARLVRPVTETDRAALSRAKKQLAALEMLSAGPLPAAVVNAQYPGAVKALCEKGYVCIEQQESLRRPYGAIEAERAVEPELTRAQSAAVGELTAAMDARGGRFLLHGVTGSGKTEVYIRLIREAFARGKGAIVLVPEIALTPQMVNWFRARFGDDAAVLHSRLSAGERFDEWRRIRMGGARVVIGARSAIFAPLEDLGAIIVDEEHEHTYFSEHRPRYDAREVARMRAEEAGAVLLLGSATPSIASYMRCMPGVRPENKISLIEMDARVNGRALPEVEIVDMAREFSRGNTSIFSAKLQSALRECVGAGRQAMLLMNRRGYNTFVSCRSCGYVVKCEQCDVAMTYHMSEGVMRCHYCGAERMPPTLCPDCRSQYIRYFGAGTQKVEEELTKLLPGVPVGRMDIDTTREKDSHERILGAFRRGETRVLVGTQMIAKGLDFPNVTLVGVVAADMTLNVPDYRSAERAFQLLTQAAGRAGRAKEPGRVIVQTYEPNHYAIRLAAQQDYRAFYHLEADYRRKGLYPPFTVLARLMAVSKDEGAAQKAAEQLEAELRAWLEKRPQAARDVIKIHTRPAPMKRLRGEFRFQVFVKMYAKGASDEILQQMEEMAQGACSAAKVDLEVNPVNLM
ncbi:MAG: primosomal protein N' [Eubacteriales bacterium]|nr:primosomal protein N' [Eubacteriales bacterium]